MSDARQHGRSETTYSDPDDVRGPLWEEAVAASAARGALVPAGVDDDASEDEPLAPDDVSGNLRRYVRWQWRDFWGTRGVWLAGITLLVVWAARSHFDTATLHRLYERLYYLGRDGTQVAGPTFAEWLGSVLVYAFSQFAILASVGATFGVVAHERERGLQRFLFAKPVDRTRYYLQKLGIAGIGFLVLALLGVALAAAAVAAPLHVGALLTVAVCTFVAVGGFTFLMSTLTRFDSVATIALLIASVPAMAAAHSRSAWAPLARLAQWMLPPGEALAVLGGSPGANGVSYPGAVAWSLAYGGACVAAGVWVLRRRSTTT